MHLFDAETREEVTLCGAGASAYDRITVQYCLGQLIDGLRVGNICRSCMVRAVCWTEGHCRKLEADAIQLRAKALRLHERDATRYRNCLEESDMEADRLLLEARELRQLAGRLEEEKGLN